MGGIHNNTVLYYFAQSSFYDKTSNNEILFQQGCNNPNMAQFLATRELFEGRLRTMSGLEFVVAQEPAETGPGAGTGVWVINKQTRRKRQGEEDEIIVHSTYFLCDGTIFMAPSLADVLSMRIVGAPLPNPHHHLHFNTKLLKSRHTSPTTSPKSFPRPPKSKPGPLPTAESTTNPRSTNPPQPPPPTTKQPLPSPQNSNSAIKIQPTTFLPLPSSTIS